MFLAKALRTFRTSSGISRQELATRLGMDDNSIARWENGERQLNDRSFSEAAQAMGVDAETVLTSLLTPNREVEPDLLAQAITEGAEWMKNNVPKEIDGEWREKIQANFIAWLYAEKLENKAMDDEKARVRLKGMLEAKKIGEKISAKEKAESPPKEKG